MHTFITGALWGVAIAGGMTFLGATAAGAAETGGEEGILSGSQIEAPISIPVTVVDNAISLLGSSSVEGSSAAEPAPAAEQTPGAESATTDGSNGIGSGSQALVEVTVPVTVAGNSIAVLGESTVDGGAPAAPGATGGAGTGQAGAAQAATDGSDSVLGGTQVVAPVTAPVTVSGNAISLLGESSVSDAGDAAPAGGASPPVPLTSGLGGVLSGSQVAAPISIPLTVGGNAIAVLGESTVAAQAPVPAGDPGPVPGTDPGPDPGAIPGTVPALVVPAAAAAGTGSGVLALTGGAGMIPLVLAVLGLLGAGGLLLRRRAA